MSLCARVMFIPPLASDNLPPSSPVWLQVWPKYRELTAMSLTLGQPHNPRELMGSPITFGNLEKNPTPLPSFL